MASPAVIRRRAALDTYQGPSALEDAATASNSSFQLADRLRHGDLLSESEVLFGAPFEVSSWRWRASDGASKRANGASSAPRALEPVAVPKKSRPHLDPRRTLRDTVWIGQEPPPPDVSDPNADPAVWPPSHRGTHRYDEHQRSQSATRFVATEELTGQIDEVDHEAGTVACTVWRRPLEHDSYVTTLRIEEFPEGQRDLVQPGNQFYWTFGDLYVPELPGSYATSRIVMRRPMPALVAERLAESAARRFDR